MSWCKSLVNLTKEQKQLKMIERGGEESDPIQSLKLSAMGTFWVQNAIRNGDLAAGHGPVSIVIACIR